MESIRTFIVNNYPVVRDFNDTLHQIVATYPDITDSEEVRPILLKLCENGVIDYTGRKPLTLVNPKQKENDIDYYQALEYATDNFVPMED